MPRVTLDAHMPEHPKILRLSEAARWRFLESLCYLRRFPLLDGKLPAEYVEQTRPSVRRELLAELWHANGDGGAVVHDYHDYQPSADDIARDIERDERRRAQAAERMRRMRNRRKRRPDA